MSPLTTEDGVAARRAAGNGRVEIVAFETYTADRLADLPAPEFLIPDLMPARGLTVDIGASGVGKSFGAITKSCCIAARSDWNGQPVKQGAVVYIAAEGSSGLLRRIDAWCAENDQRRPEHLHFLPEVVNFLDGHDMDRLQATVDAMEPPPVLIVVDTMARAMPGGEENSNKDVGLLVYHLDRIRQPIGAAGLIVHHPRKDSDSERGATALRGAADAMTLLKRTAGDGRRLDVTKMKDAEEGPPTFFQLVPAHGSQVIRFKDDLGVIAGVMGPPERKLLELLRDTHAGEDTSTTRLQSTCEMPGSSFYDALSALKGAGYVAAESEGRKRFNYLTEKGRAALDRSLQKAPDSSAQPVRIAPRAPASIEAEQSTGAMDGADDAAQQEALL